MMTRSTAAKGTTWAAATLPILLPSATTMTSFAAANHGLLNLGFRQVGVGHSVFRCHTVATKKQLVRVNFRYEQSAQRIHQGMLHVTDGAAGHHDGDVRAPLQLYRDIEGAGADDQVLQSGNRRAISVVVVPDVQKDEMSRPDGLAAASAMRTFSSR